MKFVSTLRHLKAVSLALALPAMSHGATILDDVFTGGSDINQAPGTPTGTSTSYEWFSGISGGTASIGSGSMTLNLPTTGSIVGEVQAMFNTSPISLVTAGDYIDIRVSFVDTANLMLAGNANSSLAIGLFASGGVKPNQGVVQLNNGNVTGGSQNWKGFASLVLQNSASNRIFTRGAQTASGTTSQNQDLLFNNASSSQTFNSPTGAQVGNTKSTAAANVVFTAGNLYTNYMRITLSAVGTLTISNQVSGASGILFDHAESGLLATLNNATNSFDSFAFGWRESVSPSAASTMTVNEILVTAVTTIPEPSTVALAGLGVLGLFYARRQKRG